MAHKPLVKPTLEPYPIHLKSGRVVTMQPLSMRLQMKIDNLASGEDDRQAESGYLRVAAMIVALDGTDFPAIGSPDKLRESLEDVMEYFTGDEANEMLIHYAKKSGLDQVKK